MNNMIERILIIGFGSIGQRHLKNIKIIDPQIKVAVLRTEKNRTRTISEGESKGETFFYSEEDALEWQPQAIVVANPASAHMTTALPFARSGSHIFIEKPLSSMLDGVDELIHICHQNGLVLAVGYMLRFFEPLLIMKGAILGGKIGHVLGIRAGVGQYLPDWRPNRDYRQTVSARKELGGGVIFELSHELDYVRWLVGEIKTVAAFSDTVSDLEIDVEDIAEIIMKFENGAVGSVHVDMVDHAGGRECRVTGSEGTIVWKSDEENRVRLYSAQSKEWIDLRPEGPIDRNDMYVQELKHFLECVERGKTPLVSGEDGRRVVEIALAIKKSSQEGGVVTL